MSYCFHYKFLCYVIFLLRFSADKNKSDDMMEENSCLMAHETERKLGCDLIF